MPKYINAEDLVQETNDWDKTVVDIYTEGYQDGLNRVRNIALSMPSEEIVHCEDCKYWGVYDEPIKHCMKGMLKLPVHGYEFCCRGERKETE